MLRWGYTRIGSTPNDNYTMGDLPTTSQFTAFCTVQFFVSEVRGVCLVGRTRSWSGGENYDVSTSQSAEIVILGRGPWSLGYLRVQGLCAVTRTASAYSFGLDLEVKIVSLLRFQLRHCEGANATAFVRVRLWKCMQCQCATLCKACTYLYTRVFAMREMDHES